MPVAPVGPESIFGDPCWVVEWVFGEEKLLMDVP